MRRMFGTGQASNASGSSENIRLPLHTSPASFVSLLLLLIHRSSSTVHPTFPKIASSQQVANSLLWIFVQTPFLIVLLFAPLICTTYSRSANVKPSTSLFPPPRCPPLPRSCWSHETCAFLTVLPPSWFQVSQKSGPFLLSSKRYVYLRVCLELFWTSPQGVGGNLLQPPARAVDARPRMAM
ncbi:hypothetical protein BDV96DRAFT_569425 [Lophiotrema nucula]|uniref:Uncharacterized protein n=1 Tax=Lophiotrema nucula TaxID=690887 RepID=A0A6A5ZG34_9PLEO|nr:hypothetical protein BDV96DRAFT_569425 [Lophiotrema nucula]